MKKIFTLLLTTCILLTGCSKTSLKNVQKNLEQAENYNAKVTLTISGTFIDEKIEYNRTKNVTIDNINGTAKVNATIARNEEEEKETYYIKTVNKTATTYKELDGLYESREEQKDQNSIYYITAFVNENAELIQEDNVDDKKYYVLSLKKDRVVSFLNSYYDVEILVDNEYTVTNDVMLKLIINKKGQIEKLEADFTGAIKYKNVNYELDEFKLTIEYSNFNNAGIIEIPNEIINSSINTDLVKLRQYAYEYVKEVNELQLGNTTMTNTLGYTIESTELTVIDNIVESGIIKIDGYIIEIVNKEIGVPKK